MARREGGRLARQAAAGGEEEPSVLCCSARRSPTTNRSAARPERRRAVGGGGPRAPARSWGGRPRARRRLEVEPTAACASAGRVGAAAGAGWGGEGGGGGDLEGEEATSGWVGFVRTRSGCSGLWMDGWTCGGLGLAMDGRMSAMSSIRVIDGSTNQNPAYVIVFFCFFYIFYPLISGKHSTY